MAIPRFQLVDSLLPELHHCLSRCVRRAFLLSQTDDSRRCWLIERLWLLTSCYAIDVVAVAVMANHFHLLARTLPDVVTDWSDAEVAYRWILLHPQRRQRRALKIDFDALPQQVEIERLLANPDTIEACRRKLGSLSFFMKDLKQSIAVRCNLADDVRGHFWESRFKSHRILDEAAALLCAAYIDMNPVRAGMADSALLASHTSVAQHAKRQWRDLAESRQDGTQGEGAALRNRFAGTTVDDARNESRNNLDAFVASFDDAVFVPAIPARREAWTTESTSDTAGKSQSSTAVADVGSAATHTPMSTPPEAAVGIPAHSSPQARARSIDSTPPSAPTPPTPPPPPTTRAEAAAAPRRLTSPVRMLGLTLGDYFRRLRQLSEQFAQSHGLPRSRTAGRAAPASVEELLDDPSRIDELLAVAARSLAMWGTAIGSTASRAAEAVRRKLVGRNRVALAFEIPEEDLSPSRCLRRAHSPMTAR